jgi:hypothetical protein
MNFSKIIMLATLLIATGYADFVSAHTQSGALGRKNFKVGGTDKFLVRCFNDNAGKPDHLSLHVFDLPPRNPAKVSIRAIFPATGAATVISTDNIDSDRFPSPEVSLSGGAGLYQMNISRNRSTIKGAEVYLVEFHCETAAGAHTGTTEPQMIQNQ